MLAYLDEFAGSADLVTADGGKDQKALFGRLARIEGTCSSPILAASFN